RQPVTLAFRLGELLALIGDELRDRLTHLLFDSFEHGRAFPELSLLSNLASDLSLMAFECIDDLGTRTRTSLVDQFTHVSTFSGESDNLFTGGNALGQSTNGRAGLCRLSLVGFQICAKLCQVGSKDIQFPLAQGWADSRWELDGSYLMIKAGGLNGCSATQGLGDSCFEVTPQACFIGRGFGRVKLDQHVASLHVAAVLNKRGGDLTRLERLHYLRAAAWLDLAGSNGIDIDHPEIRPSQGQQKQSTNRENHTDSDW